MKLATRIFRRDDWYITSKFGYRQPLSTSVGVTSSFHSGVDYGTNVQKWNQYALEKGIVLFAGNSTVSGNYVWVKYPRLGIKLLHCHMDELKVKKGQEVDENTVLGTTGKTGRVTGIHLHLGMQYLDKATYVDPELYDYVPEEKKEEEKIPTPEHIENDFEEGDIVEPINLVNVDGKPLTQYDESYTITNLNGDRATLSVRGSIWATLYLKDIRKVGETPKKETFEVGDKVVPTRLVNYNGVKLTQYDEYYTISSKSKENPDKVTLSARGQIWATMNIKDIKHI